MSFKADQKSDSPILPPEKPKPQPCLNFDLNMFQLIIFCLK